MSTSSFPSPPPLSISLPNLNIPLPQAPPEYLPNEIAEYLKSMGWEMNMNGSQYFFRSLNGRPAGYYSWSEAVTYCLIKPFLKEE